MAETIANWFVTTFEGTLAREWIVFLVSLLPILELRGGIIAGFAMNMEWLPTFIIAYIGNIVPIPFILLFIRYIFKVLKKTPMRKVVEWCERRADQKSEQIRKYAYWGVFLFVAVPLPGTGAWMGALISALLGMDPKKTFPVIMAGVLTASIIVFISKRIAVRTSSLTATFWIISQNAPVSQKRTVCWKSVPVSAV